MLSNDGSTCRFFFTLVVDVGRLYRCCADLTFVEYCRIRDVDTVECTVVEHAAVSERGEWQGLDHFKCAVDEDAAVTELDEVGDGGVLEDGAVGEAATGTETAAIFHWSVLTDVPGGALE